MARFQWRCSAVDIGNRTPDVDLHRKRGASVQFLAGKILFNGGRDDRYSPSVWNSAIVIDATNGTPVTTSNGNMNYARAFQNLVMLPTGEVMVLAGNTSGIKVSDSGGVTVPEIWNPSTGLWRTVAPQAVPRGYPCRRSSPPRCPRSHERRRPLRLLS